MPRFMLVPWVAGAPMSIALVDGVARLFQISTLASALRLAAQLDASERSLTLRHERGPQRISEEAIANFGKLISKQLRGGNPAMRKAYVWLLIDNVRVENQAIHIQGTRRGWKVPVVRSDDAAISMVPGFDRKWCRLQDSNL